MWLQGNARGNLDLASMALVVQQRLDIEVDRDRPASRRVLDFVHRGEARGLASVRVNQGEVRERHDRSDWLARAFDDDPLASGGFVDDLAETAPNIERGHDSHSAMIARCQCLTGASQRSIWCQPDGRTPAGGTDESQVA